MGIRQGDIYFVDFGLPRNREPAYDHPAVVVSTNQINALAQRGTIVLVTVVPGTSGKNVKRNHPTDVRVPTMHSGLPNETVFRAFQLTSIDASRFSSRPAGRLSDEYFVRVQDAMQFVLGPRWASGPSIS